MLIDELKLERILVVIDADQLESEKLTESMLVSRAVAFAKSVGAQVELFHACHDATFEQKLFFSDASVLSERANIADRYATRVSELILGTGLAGVPIDGEVRWDSPEVDAILRRIAEYKPDIVMLRASSHDYVVGLVSHKEWELIRQSPVPVWFVSDDIAGISKIVAAIGTASNNDNIISASDYGVFRVADAVAKAFNAESFPVHAFEVPPGISAYAAYGPIIGPAGPPAPQVVEEQAAASRRIAEEHGEQLRSFAEFFNIDPNRVQIAQGDPAEVIAEAAESLGADVILMGSRNLNRWQRAYKHVTAEPVLASTNCDVVFTKTREDVDVPKAEEHPIPGKPTLDVEAAITKPETIFESPAAVAEETAISSELQLHILDAWEQDVRAKLVMQDEGGEPKPVDCDILEQIQNAKKQADPRQRNDRQTNLA
jgi:universal stress protein E